MAYYETPDGKTYSTPRQDSVQVDKPQQAAPKNVTGYYRPGKGGGGGGRGGTKAPAPTYVYKSYQLTGGGIAYRKVQSSALTAAQSASVGKGGSGFYSTEAAAQSAVQQRQQQVAQQQAQQQTQQAQQRKQQQITRSPQRLEAARPTKTQQGKPPVYYSPSKDWKPTQAKGDYTVVGIDRGRTTGDIRGPGYTGEIQPGVSIRKGARYKSEGKIITGEKVVKSQTADIQRQVAQERIAQAQLQKEIKAQQTTSSLMDAPVKGKPVEFSATGAPVTINVAGLGTKTGRDVKYLGVGTGGTGGLWPTISKSKTYIKVDTALKGALPGGVEPTTIAYTKMIKPAWEYTKKSYEGGKEILLAPFSEGTKVIKPVAQKTYDVAWGSLESVAKPFGERKYEKVSKAYSIEGEAAFERKIGYKQKPGVPFGMQTSIRKGQTFEDYWKPETAVAKKQVGTTTAIVGTTVVGAKLLGASVDLFGAARTGVIKATGIKGGISEFVMVDAPIAYGISAGTKKIAEPTLKGLYLSSEESGLRAEVGEDVMKTLIRTGEGKREEGMNWVQRIGHEFVPFAAGSGTVKQTAYEKSLKMGYSESKSQQLSKLAVKESVIEGTVHTGRLLQAEMFANLVGGQLAAEKGFTTPAGMGKLKTMNWWPRTKAWAQTKYIPGAVEGLTSTQTFLDRYGIERWLPKTTTKTVHKIGGDTETTITKEQGRLPWLIGGSAFGAVSAATFGGLEMGVIKTKVGQKIVAGAGYAMDVPEAPGDILSTLTVGRGAPIGRVRGATFTTAGVAPSFQAIKVTSKTSPTERAMQLRSGEKITKGSKEFQELLDISKGVWKGKRGQVALFPSVTKERSLIKLPTVTKTTQKQIGSVPIDSFTQMKTIIKTKEKVPSAFSLSPSTTKAVSTIPIYDMTFGMEKSSTSVDVQEKALVETTTDTTDIANAFNTTYSITNLTQTQTQADVFTDVNVNINVFTPKFPLPIVPGPLGGSPWGRRGRRRVPRRKKPGYAATLWGPTVRVPSVGAKVKGLGMRQWGLSARPKILPALPGMIGAPKTKKKKKKKKSTTIKLIIS